VPTDCANPAFAAAYNFYCAYVGPGGPAPAPGANPQAINNGVEGGLGNSGALPGAPSVPIAENDIPGTAGEGTKPDGDTYDVANGGGACNLLADPTCMVLHPETDPRAGYNVATESYCILVRDGDNCRLQDKPVH
jgi:hypothetical protein